ncbi:MAG: acetolactate synthase small subunit [Calditrichia bacterium]|nr:acetolactate synthase small subunit [Calditrichota bacterium]MCB9070270.1 acetolactate synthase small subunit [Calditrichia bacterium]
MRHTINLLVENKMGSLSRIAGLFLARGYNIDSLSVGDAEEEGLSRMTIVVHGDDKVIEQITKQLNKVVDVLRVNDLTMESYVNRELALIKVQALPSKRSEIMQIVDVFRAKIVDISPQTLTIETTGSEDKVQAMINMLRPFGLKEVSRTGRIAIKREFQGETN